MSREWRIDEDGDLALWVDGKHARWFNGTEADAVELRPILERGQAEPVADDPLPEGVHRAPDGTLLWHALDHPMPEGYEAFRNGCWGPMGHDPRHDFWYAVRPVQQTEPVAWWEALRDKRRFHSNDSGNGQRIAGCLRATNGWTLTTANGYQRFAPIVECDIAGEVIKADQT